MQNGMNQWCHGLHSFKTLACQVTNPEIATGKRVSTKGSGKWAILSAIK